MFANLLFLIIVLLLVSIAIDSDLHPFMDSLTTSFEMGILTYLLVLILIYTQAKLGRRFKLPRGALLTLVNLQLIVFLAFFYFALGAHRLIQEAPLLKGTRTFISLLALLFYFGGLAVFHSCYRPSASQANSQLRFLLPFVLPFLLFTVLLDLFQFFPIAKLDIFVNQDDPLGTLVLFILTLFFMALMMVFLPFAIQWIWGCKDLEDMELLERLETICRLAQFKHAGFKTWTAMSDSLTAAIVGIVPRFRYIMFTKRLLERMSPQSIEAILAHEIGHSYRKHLLIYPAIFFGMITLCGLFSLFFSDGLTTYFEQHNRLYPSPIWDLLNILMIFIPYTLIIALYYRYVFGYFSRTFERQADLHGYVLGLSPEQMITALDDIAIATGYTHAQPSWHHYSIQERIDFLEDTKRDPSLIAKHHRQAKISMFVYLIALAIGFSFLAAPYLSDFPVFKQIHTWTEAVSRLFSDWINASLQPHTGVLSL
jgi:STE24 endopeptidase